MGTALSLWDAAALDAAGEESEVAPTFINLADASIKMVSLEVSILTWQPMDRTDNILVKD